VYRSNYKEGQQVQTYLAAFEVILKEPVLPTLALLLDVLGIEDIEVVNLRRELFLPGALRLLSIVSKAHGHRKGLLAT
jgi:hypothetical protein